jgi:hypothetical protein
VETAGVGFVHLASQAGVYAHSPLSLGSNSHFVILPYAPPFHNKKGPGRSEETARVRHEESSVLYRVRQERRKRLSSPIDPHPLSHRPTPDSRPLTFEFSFNVLDARQAWLQIIG